MSPEQMREALKKSYPSVSWHQKVDKMADKQLAATYFRLQRSKSL